MVKYKVSLLPEQSRKRLNSKKKLEKIRINALITLCVLALFTFVVMFTTVFANKQLDKAKKLDSECAQEVAQLEQFREINANLQSKVQLIESIQVNEPMLVNFIASVSNLRSPGVSIQGFECTDWKVSRVCNITGTCDNREQYLAFEEAVGKLEGVSGVSCISYVQGTSETGDVLFTITVTCSGGSAPLETAPPETTAAATDEATDVAVE
ncbi:MAG: hypothetical protein ACI4VW_04550 [Acutalibacteraceae bacterium]